MAKVNYKDKQTQWTNQHGLCLITFIGLLAIALTWDYTPQVKETPEPIIVEAPAEIVITPITADDLLTQESINCLIQNSYYEARDQDIDAITGVVHVSLNRWNDRRYPNDICDVIYQSKVDYYGRIILNQCQFSWYCDGKSDNPKNKVAYERVSEITKKAIILWYLNMDITDGSTHYHSIKVYPDWAPTLAYTKQIGDHKFYRWN